MELAQFLNQSCRVKIKDERIFDGVLVCLDNKMNVILHSAWEFRGEERRFIGLITIRGVHIDKVYTMTTGIPESEEIC